MRLHTYLAVGAVVLASAGQTGAAPRNELPSSGNLKITAPMLSFNYQTFEAGTSMRCTHEIFNAAAQDWKVTCSDSSTRAAKIFIVHLWVTLYQRTFQPKLSYE